MAKDTKSNSGIIVNEFTEYGVSEFKLDFERLRAQNLPLIPIYIDSYGGEVYSLLAMLDIIASSSIPVATICLGKAMSCGSILLACGEPGLRFIGQNSTVMIHDVGSFSFGKIEDLKADVFEAERLNNSIFDLLATKCGKPKDYFRKLVAQKKHANWYLNANEAKTHGLVDHIGIPNLESKYIFQLLPKKAKLVKAKKTKKK